MQLKLSWCQENTFFDPIDKRLNNDTFMFEFCNASGVMKAGKEVHVNDMSVWQSEFMIKERSLVVRRVASIFQL